MASLPPSADPSGAAPSDRLWLRSELMGTQVITRDTGRRLGVVGEVVVDIDRREVVALGLRDNPLTRFLPGLPRWMPLDRIRQVGDVILVDSADSLSEGFNPERYSKVINCQVITESGEQLGRVLGFSFDIETGDLTTLVLGALGLPLLGEGVLSTWELSVVEIVSSGPDRIIVYEGAEEKLKQLGTGLLEKLGIGGPSWEQEERDRYRLNMVPVENQLAAGQPSEQAQRRIQPATSRAFEPEEELEYVELERRREEPLRQRRYLDEDDDGYENPRGSGRPLEREAAWSDRDRPSAEQEPRPATREFSGRDRAPDRNDGVDRPRSERTASEGYRGEPDSGERPERAPYPRERYETSREPRSWNDREPEGRPDRIADRVDDGYERYERPPEEPLRRPATEAPRDLPLKPRAGRRPSLEPLDVEPEPYEGTDFDAKDFDARNLETTDDAGDSRQRDSRGSAAPIDDPW